MTTTTTAAKTEEIYGDTGDDDIDDESDRIGDKACEEGDERSRVS